MRIVREWNRLWGPEYESGVDQLRVGRKPRDLVQVLRAESFRGRDSPARQFLEYLGAKRRLVHPITLPGHSSSRYYVVRCSAVAVAAVASASQAWNVGISRSRIDASSVTLVS